MQRAPRHDLASSLALAIFASACVGHIEEPAADSLRRGAVGPLGDIGTDNPSSNAGPKTTHTADGTTSPGADPGRLDPDSAAANSGWPSFDDARAFQLRRLTARQYSAAVSSLLGVDASALPAIERVSPVGGFEEMGASYSSVSAMGVSQFEEAARAAAHAAFADNGPGRKRVACTPKDASDSACFEQLARSFGLQAFRRPLLDAEVSRYASLTQTIASATSDPWQGIEATVSAFLQSPNFLYLTEVAEPDPANKQRYRFTSFEMASRLAYFLTGDTPDAQLLAAAADDKLLSSDEISKQAQRLLASDPARNAVRRFWSSLLSLDNLDTLARPSELYPEFTPTLGAALKQETMLVVDDLVFQRDGDYRQLFDQRETFVNPELAKLYGVSLPAGADFMRVTLPDSSHRAGLLGHAGVLAARDHSDGTSPTRRGLFVLTRLLCQNLPLMPPANLQIPPPPMGLLTARERLEEHTTNPVCASCHRITDPVGLSLEHFNAMGVYHEDDRGMQIDDSGEIDGMKYHGEVELGGLLRDHPALGPCLIQALYGVAVGHVATDFDRASFADLVQSFADNGARVRALLTQITASDGFRFLPPPTDN